MNKTDPILGALVHEHLLAVGVETPLAPQLLGVADKEKVAKITALFTDIWQTLGLDLADDSLKDTPARMAKMYVHEIYQGLHPENFPKCTTVDNKMQYNEMILERNINVQSNCEHHGVVISGRASVAYIPSDKVLGLSKINRVVEYFCKRPQIQERLTEQIYHALSFILGTASVAVVVDAEHYCVKSRGIRDVGSSTVTSKIGGAFLKPSVRAEFFSLIATKS